MIQQSERERLIETVCREKPRTVFAVQDTTTLDFSTARSASSLGTFDKAWQHGFLVHSCLFLDEKGVSMGLFDQYYWSRDAAQLGRRSALRKQLPIEEKESHRWVRCLQSVEKVFSTDLDTTFVVLGDRESDIFEIFEAPKRPNVHFLVRGRGDRNEAQHGLPIRAALLRNLEAPIGVREVEILDKNPAVRRIAKLEIRFQTVGLAPSTSTPSSKKRKPLALQVVWAREIDAPQAVQKPIDWLLFTSLPVENWEQAVERVEQYRLRWRIEQFHFTLKSGGCEVEKLQIQDPQALQNARCLYAILAAQALKIYCVNQIEPQKPIETIGFEAKDHRVLAIYLRSKAKTEFDPDLKNPTFGHFVRMIAKLGGYATQSNKPIGIKIICRGLQDFDIIQKAFVAFLQNPTGFT